MEAVTWTRGLTLLAGLGIIVAAGCQPSALGSDAGAGTGGSSGTMGSAGSGGTTGTGGTAIVSLPPTCPGTCDMPAGTVYAFQSTEEIYAALAGSWEICTGAMFGTAPADAIGVEYGPGSAVPTPGGSTVGGNMYFLVQGSNGPVRGAGFDYQLTYDVSPEGAGHWQLNMHPTPNSGFAGTVRYSPCPRELEITNVSVSGRSILVPF